MTVPDTETDTRTGHVKIHTTEPDVSLWASCDLQSGERMAILEQADRVLDMDSIPVNTTIGQVTIERGDVEFEADELILEDYSWEASGSNE